MATKNKVKEQPRRIFCKFGKMVVRIDHVEKHGCNEYSPTMSMKPPFCGVCIHMASLNDDGSDGAEYVITVTVSDPPRRPTGQEGV